MDVEEINVLSSDLISEYWCDFKASRTWNYYLWDPKYVRGEKWAPIDKWVSVSKECIEENLNVIQSLEILLREEFENYVSSAESFVHEWYKGGGHDAYYYFDILSMLPKNNHVRRKVLSVDSFYNLYADDPEVMSARRALARAGDEDFVRHAGRYINDLFERDRLSESLIENHIIPIMLDMGGVVNSCVSEENLNRVKILCLEYYDKDREVIERIMGGVNQDEGQRQVWVGDNLAYFSWVFDWHDVLDMLGNDELYWSGIFSELWDDPENYNLLVWSLVRDDVLLRSRAEYVMVNHELHKLDGAIAWSRLTDMTKENPQR